MPPFEVSGVYTFSYEVSDGFFTDTTVVNILVPIIEVNSAMLMSTTQLFKHRYDPNIDNRQCGHRYRFAVWIIT